MKNILLNNKHFHFYYKETMTDYEKSDFFLLYLLVANYFNDNWKTDLWFNEKNTHLGSQSPVELIVSGRIKKLRSFVDACLEENML